MNTNNIPEAVAATAATGAAGAAAWLGHVDHALVILGHLAAVVWWLRLWIKKPELKPPAR
jgi:hypothetical protein